MNIIGISAFYHESACCLLQNGKVIAAAQEERFTRIKHDKRLPINAFKYCLNEGGIGLADITCIAYYENPRNKLSRQLWMGLNKTINSQYSWLDGRKVEREIREAFGYEGKILYFNHHQSHAASSYYYSGFSESAIMTIDGVGEWETTTYSYGKEHKIKLLENVLFPHSIGLLYSTLTNYLGFRVLGGEYKVMGLAPYGKPIYMEEMRKLIRLLKKGQFELNMKYFSFSTSERMYTNELIDLFQISGRVPESEILQKHKDIASSLQQLLNEIILEKVNYLYEITNSRNLCLSGGVALNCVMISYIRKYSKFNNIYTQPASTDAGSSLGAAALAFVKYKEKKPNTLSNIFLGPKFSIESISNLLLTMGIEAIDCRENTKKLFDITTTKLLDGKIIGWFQGRMEFGPRALGARSILADPRNPKIRNHINSLVKKREDFRPFAPSVLEEFYTEHFSLTHPSRFMGETCSVKSKIYLPAITHVDNSARPQIVSSIQNKRYEGLIKEFYRKTACPILVNTSFNMRGEPIVCTPEDAIKCMIDSNIDYLIIEDFIISKHNIPNSLKKILKDTKEKEKYEGKIKRNYLNGIERWSPSELEVPENIYTFI